MQDVQKLSKEDLLDMFSAIHKMYLIKNNLFNKLLKYCMSQGVLLPDLSELLNSK